MIWGAVRATRGRWTDWCGGDGEQVNEGGGATGGAERPPVRSPRGGPGRPNACRRGGCRGVHRGARTCQDVDIIIRYLNMVILGRLHVDSSPPQRELCGTLEQIVEQIVVARYGTTTNEPTRRAVLEHKGALRTIHQTPRRFVHRGDRDVVRVPSDTVQGTRTHPRGLRLAIASPNEERDA